MSEFSTTNAIVGRNIEGIYSRTQFVLRLSPANHSIIDAINSGDLKEEDFDQRTFDAISTLLHETIHWWQHMGSISGFVLSMAYPLQLHSNFPSIKEWCSYGDVSKPIEKSATAGEQSGLTHTDKRQGCANLIVNNTKDYDFFVDWLLRPSNAESIMRDPHFHSQGHCFRVVYTELLGLISQLIDPENTIIPESASWVEAFDALNENQVMGYYRGSRAFRRPIGALEIFEGQASFNQMQFLARSGTHSENLTHFTSIGLLHGVYEQAFQRFIQELDIDTPDSVLSREVTLFLLICDLSINPVEGFLCDIPSFEKFVNDADPCIRFLKLCRVAAKNQEALLEFVGDYSRDGYLEASAILLSGAGLASIQNGLDRLSSLVSTDSPLSALLEEQRHLRYTDESVVLRVMLSHFVSFNLDRRSNPHYLCWPGYWNVEMTPEMEDIWARNGCLFSDQEHNDGIFIKKMPGVEEEDSQNTINHFFAGIVLCDLSRQWVLETGDFSFNFKWLSEKSDEGYWRILADSAFSAMFGVKASEIKLT